MANAYENIFGGQGFGQPAPKGTNPYEGLFEPPVLQTGPYNANTPPPNAQSSQGVIDKMMGGINSDGLSDIASMVGAFSSGEKANRVVGGNFYQDFDRMMLDRESNVNRTMLDAQRERNLNEADALKKLQQTAYIKDNEGYKPASISLSGQTRQLPTFGIGAKASTDEEKAGANTLQNTIMSRFEEDGSYQPGFSYQPTPVDQYAKPGTAENLSSYGATATGILGGLGKVFGGGGSGSGGGVGSAINNLIGKDALIGGGSSAGGGIGSFLGNNAVPLAGAATGIMGLMKDRGAPSNIMNGVTAGASIGSIVPGIGTAIGAGVGGLVGGLRGIGGGPSEEEKAGRPVAAQARQTIAQGATPQQFEEAQKAGWPNPTDALALIVVRDQLIQSGKPPQLADQLMKQLFEAEKGGPQAVQQVLSNIMAVTGKGGPTGSAQPAGVYRG